MFRDYTAVSSKMKSNYSKLYDITAVQWNARCYVIPLTNSEGFTKTFLQSRQILRTHKTKKEEELVETKRAGVALIEH